MCKVKDNNCMLSQVVYKNSVMVNRKTSIYIRSMVNFLKQCIATHKFTFRNSNLRNSTSLSKFIWQLKDNNVSYSSN